jgi:hypothetical protein
VEETKLPDSLGVVVFLSKNLNKLFPELEICAEVQDF